jgi:hypothetical protein
MTSYSDQMYIMLGTRFDIIGTGSAGLKKQDMRVYHEWAHSGRNFGPVGLLSR